jgi:glutamate N-acetyltransferase/amino-acid N-acetyltransferase
VNAAPAADAPPVELCPVAGVRLAAVEAGIRYADRLDLVAIAFDEGTQAAAVFTRNAFRAAPVQVAQRHLEACAGRPRLLLVNTGNANAGTGAAGIDAALHCCRSAAAAAAVDAGSVLPFSTGVIGEDLPLAPIDAALPNLVDALRADGWAQAARGILTTDTRPKGTSRHVDVDGERYTLTGIAKGAGMLRPDMATMLAFIATDAPLSRDVCDALLRRAVAASFHRISVDGDTSTNDAVLFAATGAQGGAVVTAVDTPIATALGEALTDLCVELAQALVRDGEGASKFVEVCVSGGRDSHECLQVAFTIAHSPLVKTALFASDPNWGRILAAIGRAGLVDLDVTAVRILINDLPIAEGGSRASAYREEAAATAMAAAELRLDVELGRGEARETVWTSDFSYDYVRINAEYRS